MQTRVVHVIHHPVSAKNFVMPIVSWLNAHQIPTELWLENQTRFADVLAAITVPKRYLPTAISFNPIEFWRRFRRYRRALRETQPEVLHAHQTRAAIIPLLAAWVERVPTRVYHLHGLAYNAYHGPSRWVVWGIDRLNILLSTHVLCVSHSILQAAREGGLFRGRACVVPGHGSVVGIDLEEFSARAFDDAARLAARTRMGLAADSFVVGYVGRPTKRKGFHRLMAAWDSSFLSRGKGTLIVAGCTPEECDRALGRPVPGVRGFGYLLDLRDFYAACDVVTLPSDQEGFPYALLEGGAAGRALLGTDIPGIVCAIRRDETGLLVPLEDTKALQAAIERLANDPALCRRLGRNARERAEKEFSRPLVLDNVLEYYRQELGVVGSPTPPRQA